MKRLYLMASFCAIATTGFAQKTGHTDSSYRNKYSDTIRIGSILIIKKNKKAKSDTAIFVKEPARVIKHSRISTNYGVLDLGFSNWSDQTDYATAGNYLVNRPGFPAISSADLKLRSGKSRNVNIWFFMQKISLAKDNVNFKYGLGLELNNYRFRSSVSFKEGGLLPYSTTQTNQPFLFRDSVAFSKNKLAADYLTLPVMLNFATGHKPGKPAFGLSFGVSAGYLYSERNKQISNERGKQKNKGDYDLERFKFSYIGELGLGPVRLYGSYSPKSIFERSMDLRPYTFGVRFSNW